MSEQVKIVVTVPEDTADAVREAIGKAGAGRIGEYGHCSFTIKGTGRFLPGDKANPAIGAQGQLEQVAEERIEVTCDRGLAENAIAAIRQAHPYEEPAIDVYPLLDIDKLED